MIIYQTHPLEKGQMIETLLTIGSMQGCSIKEVVDAVCPTNNRKITERIQELVRLGLVWEDREPRCYNRVYLYLTDKGQRVHDHLLDIDALMGADA